METSGRLICLSTIEYSIIGSTDTPIHCPSCGFRVDVKQENLLNRISSLVIIFGGTAYILYKLSQSSRKMKRISNKFWQILGYEVNKLEPVLFKNKLHPSIAFNETKLRRSGFFDTNDVPDLDLTIPRTPKSPFLNQMDWHFNNIIINGDKHSSDSLFSDSYNSSTTSSRGLTVDRIDEVLTQIDDIKKSILEIDSQIHHVSGSKCANFNPDFFTLTNTDLETDDLIDLSVSSSQEPRTPFSELNLEWDQTDVESDNLFFNDIDVDSALSLPVTDSEKQKIKSLQELLEDAKQMGLLNNILDAINSKAVNRDSAYFED